MKCYWRYSLEGSVNSITLHWIIICCDWIGNNVQLSCIGGCPKDKDVLLKEALVDKFFLIPPQTSAVGSLMSLTVVVRTVFFHSGEYKVVLNRLRALYSQLVLNGVIDFVDREPQWSEVLFILKA